MKQCFKQYEKVRNDQILEAELRPYISQKSFKAPRFKGKKSTADEKKNYLSRQTYDAGAPINVDNLAPWRAAEEAFVGEFGEEPDIKDWPTIKEALKAVEALLRGKAGPDDFYRKLYEKLCSISGNPLENIKATPAYLYAFCKELWFILGVIEKGAPAVYWAIMNFVSRLQGFKGTFDQSVYFIQKAIFSFFYYCFGNYSNLVSGISWLEKWWEQSTPRDVLTDAGTWLGNHYYITKKAIYEPMGIDPSMPLVVPALKGAVKGYVTYNILSPKIMEMITTKAPVVTQKLAQDAMLAKLADSGQVAQDVLGQMSHHIAETTTVATVTNSNSITQMAVSALGEAAKNIDVNLLGQIAGAGLVGYGVYIVSGGDFSILSNEVYRSIEDAYKFSQQVLDNLIAPIKNFKLPLSYDEKVPQLPTNSSLQKSKDTQWEGIESTLKSRYNVDTVNSQNAFDDMVRPGGAPLKDSDVLNAIQNMPEADLTELAKKTPGIGWGRKPRKKK